MQDTYFSPAFGNRPHQLVGREDVIQTILNGLTTQPGSKDRATLVLGQRGLGKTVLLWEVADRARKQGFVVASPTVVSKDMPERIIEKIQDDGEQYAKDKRGKLVGGSVGALGFSIGLQFEKEVQETKSFGYKLLQLSRRLNEQGRGILILVDEVQANSPELRQLVTSYLELVGEQQNVALVLAGLPGAMSSVLNDKVLTFLNRANKIMLGPLSIPDIDAYYRKTFDDIGIGIDPELRKHAARATEGSPYLLQLIGHNIVLYAGDGGEVDEQTIEEAILSAQETFKQDVCSTTLAALSDKDVEFLRAMAQDEGESNISEIADRMGVSADYAQKYRKRLMDSGVIEQARRGYVAFAVPELAGYLREG